MTQGRLIQLLFNRILTHDKTAIIKLYCTQTAVDDIIINLKIEDQCWRKNTFKMYFADVWTTEDKAQWNGGNYALHGKMRLEPYWNGKI